jgi:hypothetical protein
MSIEDAATGLLIAVVCALAGLSIIFAAVTVARLAVWMWGWF